MFDSAILDVVIGLVFLLTVFSVIVSATTEAVGRFLGWRGQDLLRGVRALVDGDSKSGSNTKKTFLLFRSSFMGTNGQQHRTAIEESEVPETTDGEQNWELVAREQMDFDDLLDGGWWKQRKNRKKLPSYLSSRQFASAVLTEILPERTDNGEGKPEFSKLKAKAKNELGNSALSETVSKILDEVGNDVGEIRTRLETAYDDHMGRASGWYKRRARTVQLIAAAVIVLSFNLNVSRVAHTLYTDSEKREALAGLAGQFDCSVADGDEETEGGAGVDGAEETATGTESSQGDAGDEVETEAAGETGAEETGTTEGEDSIDCVDAVEGAIDSVEVRGLPMFWTMDDPFWGQFEQNVGTFLYVCLGYAIAWLGLVPGSRFWFDALAKLNSLRSGGKPPTKADANKDPGGRT